MTLDLILPFPILDLELALIHLYRLHSIQFLRPLLFLTHHLLLPLLPPPPYPNLLTIAGRF